MRRTEADPGSGGTSAEMLTSLYAELRRIAASQMSRSGRSLTLQPTALVHEAWMRIAVSERAKWRDRSHFVAAATAAMRHILIDRARRRRTEKHGGGQQRVSLDWTDLPAAVADDEGLLALDAALKKFAEHHAEAAALIQLQCFGGLDLSDAALVLGVPRSTAYRRWVFAKAWLQKELDRAP